MSYKKISNGVNSKIKFLTTLVLISGVILLIGAGCAKKSVSPVSTTAPEVTTQPKAEEPVAEEKTPIEKYFDKKGDVAINAEKAKAVDGLLRPILKKIYDVINEKDEVVNQVKMWEEFGPMLSYTFNREVVTADVDMFKTEITTAGGKIIDSTAKSLTVTWDYKTLVVTFFLNNQEKSGMEVTF